MALPNNDSELNKLFERLVKAKEDGTKEIEKQRKALASRIDKEIAILRKKQKLVGQVWARREEIRKEKISVIKAIFQKSIWWNIKLLISMPFIYAVFLPTILMHAVIEMYHQVAFRLYSIPLVNPKEYFIFDRQSQQYLNWFEKINCFYCSYFNCLVSYLKEIGARTERFWCPLKYAGHVKDNHSQYNHFIEPTNTKDLQEKWEKIRKF